jgi:SAM-dependent methyltransferase
MKRAGWELIWNSDRIPDRYASFAPPDNNVVDWADNLTPAAFVFDLGCGVGRHVHYLGKQGFRMAGSDIAPTGIRRTYALCAGLGLAFDGCVCEMSTLPWRDATFDAGLSIATIHHSLRAGIQRSVNEVWRILKPGGQFLVDFPCTDTRTYGDLRTQVMDGQITEVEPNTFVDERPDSDDDDGFLPHHFCDEADVRDLLSQFTIVRLWPALRPAPLELGDGLVGKWVAWAQKAS